MSKLKFFVTMIILVIVDQIVKVFVSINQGSFPITVINGVLKFTYCENRGIAFGLADGYVPVISIFTLAVLIALIVLICKNYEKLNTISAIGVTLLMSGGFGNFIDRAFRLYVVDFIDFGDLINFPIFNIADIYVVTGVALICLSCLIDYRREKVEGNNC